MTSFDLVYYCILCHRKEKVNDTKRTRTQILKKVKQRHNIKDKSCASSFSGDMKKNKTRKSTLVLETTSLRNFDEKATSKTCSFCEGSLGRCSSSCPWLFVFPPLISPTDLTQSCFIFCFQDTKLRPWWSKNTEQEKRENMEGGRLSWMLEDCKSGGGKNWRNSFLFITPPLVLRIHCRQIKEPRKRGWWCFESLGSVLKSKNRKLWDTNKP